jgi:hypothetical protein
VEWFPRLRPSAALAAGARRVYGVASSDSHGLHEGGFPVPKIYRDIAVSGMMGTVEDAMRRVLDCWTELPPPMQEAVDQFRVRLEDAIDSVYVVKRALDTQIHEAEDAEDDTDDAT